MSAYRRFDLRFVDISDFLVVVVDPRVPQWGTANEVYVAEQQHKPMFFICDGGLAKLPRWLFDVVDLDEIGGGHYGRKCNVFSTVEEVVQRLVHLDNGAVGMDREWVLIRKHLEMMRS